MGVFSSKSLFVFVMSLCLGACSGGGGSSDGGDGGIPPCDLTDNLCPEGQRCNADQTCVNANPLAILTDSLPDGRVEFLYNQAIEVEGGLTPYTWEISAADASLAFLSVTVDGHLRGTAESQVVNGSISVAVTDAGYGGGQRLEQTYVISFDLCRDGDTELCYSAADGVCYQGSRTCTDGQMGDCQASGNTSADKNQCGPECDRCEAAFADSCFEGVCACGQGQLCSGSDRCCDGQCLDVSAAIEHCGMCFNDCEQAIAHAPDAQKSCVSGICDYSGECEYGFLDCDGQHSNGCEKPMRLESCGSCDVDCNQEVTHVSSSQKVCRDEGTEYLCDYNGECASDFDDCDVDGSNGCETWLNNDQNCGGCGVDCAQSSMGSMCISPDFADPFFHTCGCEFDSLNNVPLGCGNGLFCCDHGCTDTENNAEHCGVCPAACPTGDCVSGGCACASDDDCPAPSSATSCGASGRCVCAHAGTGAQACGPGYYCCDGESGGSGGSADEDPDVGCCPKRCGQNDWENFPCVPFSR